MLMILSYAKFLFCLSLLYPQSQALPGTALQCRLRLRTAPAGGASKAVRYEAEPCNEVREVVCLLLRQWLWGNDRITNNC